MSKLTRSDFYERFGEDERLSTGLGQLEFERTVTMLDRFLPPPPATVLDIGGGSGRYAFRLAQRGYVVHLRDASSKLIDIARMKAERLPDAPLASLATGDARALDFPERSADAVLLLGPLYHLTERSQRDQALGEAHRVLKPRCPLFAAGISRFASVLDGFVQGFISDPVFVGIVEQDLKNGHHINPSNNLLYFTDAYFHRPDALKGEVEQAGFNNVELFPVEGLGAVVQNFEAIWNDLTLRRLMLDIITRTEQEESILGISPHLLCVGLKAG